MKPVSCIIRPNGAFPNNPDLPLVLYPGVLDLDIPEPSRGTAALFKSNSWWLTCRGTVGDFHQYQAAAHEVLGVVAGWGDIMFGGPEGVILSLNASDVVIVPAGVSRKLIASAGDFEVIFAYPVGQTLDMRTGESGGLKHAAGRVHAVLLPDSDPVFGRNGPLLKLWEKTLPAG